MVEEAATGRPLVVDPVAEDEVAVLEVMDEAAEPDDGRHSERSGGACELH